MAASGPAYYHHIILDVSKSYLYNEVNGKWQMVYLPFYVLLNKGFKYWSGKMW